MLQIKLKNVSLERQHKLLLKILTGKLTRGTLGYFRAEWFW